MRESHHVNYSYITDCKLHDKKGMCVIDNFLAVYSPLIKKLTREKIISECRYYYKEKQSEQRDKNDCIMLEDDTSDTEDEEEEDTVWIKNWQPKDGVSTSCLQYICEKYNISHYAYDVVNKCFLKHVTTHRNYPVLCYYAVNNHQYLIKDTKK